LIQHPLYGKGILELVEFIFNSFEERKLHVHGENVTIISINSK